MGDGARSEALSSLEPVDYDCALVQGTDKVFRAGCGGGTQLLVDGPGPVAEYRATMVRTASSTT